MEGNIDVELIERILLDLKNVLKKDPLIDEFDVLPVYESTQNKSPVIHIHNKLALEDWCVKPLYIYAYNKFFDWKLKKVKIDSDTILMLTCAILLINPEIETVWNTRKNLVCNFVAELKFSQLVLIRKPKCSSVFAHRKWILLKMKEKNSITADSIKQEFFVCSRIADLYSNNYYAWSHRSWIIQELLHTCLKSISEELVQTESWVSIHVSDHSGFHYRQFLLSCYRNCVPKTNSPPKSSSCILHQSAENCFNSPAITKTTVSFVEEINKEILFLSDLQTLYPGHETLWYHRRFLLHEIWQILSNDESQTTKPESLDCIVQSKKHKSESGSCVKWNVPDEESFLKHCLNLSVNQNWERTLILRHFKWLNNVLMWPVSTVLS